jgi:hypothetical protein
MCLALGLGVISAGRASAIIINGTPQQAAANAAAWGGIGTITNGFDPGTGALLDGTHVLTAAHLVYNIATTDIHFTIGGVQYDAQQVFIPSSYNGGTQGDIAVIQLKQTLTGVQTWGYDTGSLSESGKNVTIVGYGIGGSGSGGADGTSEPFGTLRAADNVIDLVTGATASGTLVDGTPDHHSFSVPANMIAYDFDQTGSGSGTLGGASLGVTEGTIAIGDSGSPMFQFDPVSGRYIITGVAVDSSDATDRFGEVGWGTRVSAYSAFVAASVPEPTAAAGIAAAAGAAMMLRRRRRA